MKTTNIRLAAVFAAAFATAVAAWSQTNGIGGQVVDRNGSPLEFVNVVLLSLPDSAFVQGVVTDAKGEFSMLADGRGELLKVSGMGYPHPAQRGHASPWRGGGEEQVAANSCKG